jgi:hypothetical protein
MIVGNMQRIVFLLPAFVFACGTMTRSAPLTREVELHGWVDFPIEAPEAATGMGKWAVEGSCSWILP